MNTPNCKDARPITESAPPQFPCELAFTSTGGIAKAGELVWVPFGKWNGKPNDYGRWHSWRPLPLSPTEPPTAQATGGDLNARIRSLAIERGRQWHLSINGGMAESVREKARKEVERLQAEIETLSAQATGMATPELMQVFYDFCKSCGKKDGEAWTGADIQNAQMFAVRRLEAERDALRDDLAILRETRLREIEEFNADNGAVRLALSESEALVGELSNHLGWVLPMAKGYAAEHPVGNNQAIVNEAAQALQRSGAKRTTEGKV